MGKLGRHLLLIVFCVLMVLSALPVQAQPSLPHSFYGMVEINGAPAHIGALIEVRGTGVVSGPNNPLSTSEIGLYGGIGAFDAKLVVQGTVINGTPLAFYINGIRAQCALPGGVWQYTYPFTAGEVTQLDLRLVPNDLPETVSIVPSGGYSVPGVPHLFSATYRDPDGWANLRYADLLINTSEVLVHCVALRYDVLNNRMFIRRPDDKIWQGGGAPGSIGTVQNVYVVLDYSLSTVVADEDTLTVTWAFTPSHRMSGKEHNLYLRAEDQGELNTGWVDHGDWIINRDPSLIPPPVYNRVTLAASPAKWTLDPHYKDLDGRWGLTTCYYALADSPPTGEMAPGGIFLKYDRVQDKMYLANSAGTDWGEGVTPGTADSYLTNEAVKVIVQWSSIGSNGAKELIVRWRLEFDPDFAGRHKVYMRTLDQFPEAGGDTGWVYKGWLEVQ